MGDRHFCNVLSRCSRYGFILRENVQGALESPSRSINDQLHSRYRFVDWVTCNMLWVLLCICGMVPVFYTVLTRYKPTGGLVVSGTLHVHGLHAHLSVAHAYLLDILYC